MLMHAAAARDLLGEPFESSDWARRNRCVAPARILSTLLPAVR